MARHADRIADRKPEGDAAREPLRRTPAPCPPRLAAEGQRAANRARVATAIQLRRSPSAPEDKRPDGMVDRIRTAGEAMLGGASRALNRTGLPDRLRAGVEALSGLAMDDVRVHRDSPEPAKLGALAFTKGSDIHLGPGQEEHLPHEAWHVVQQMQGRVKAAAQLKGVGINDDAALEAEADQMGTAAGHAASREVEPEPRHASVFGPVVQRKIIQALDGPPLKPDPGYSGVTLEYIARPETYLMRNDIKPTAKVIHVIDKSKKYLLGEYHNASSWTTETEHWPVDQMKEIEKRIIWNVNENEVGFYQKDRRFKQALENVDAYLVRVVLVAHNSANVLEQIIRLSRENALAIWAYWMDAIKVQLTQIRTSYDIDYEPFISRYEKMNMFTPDIIRRATPKGSRLHKIYALSVNMRDKYMRDLGGLEGRLSFMELEQKRLSKEKDSPTGIVQAKGGIDQFDDIAAHLLKSERFLPLLAKELIDISADKVPADKRTELEGFTATDPRDRKSEITDAADVVRESYMAFNIRTAEAPLLVQIGNNHVASVATMVPHAIGVDESVGLSKVTKRS